MAYNKIIYDGKTLIDLTGDTVTADKLLKDVTAHGKDGNAVVGTCTYDSDTSDANVAVAEMLVGKTAYARGTKVTGTMPNKGAVIGSISTKAQQYTIPQGYHDGGGKVSISSIEQAKLIPSNIRDGVTILGVQGTMSGLEDSNPQSKVVTPSSEVQTVLPDDGYTCLAEVTVNPIPYVESDNSAGGKTVTIG